MRGCNPRRPLGLVLGAHAQVLLLGQPSFFRVFILQHHDEVELSCTGPSNWPIRWCRRWCCRCWSRRRCCWCRCTRGVLINRTPRRFWAEAVNTACYVSNRIYTRVYKKKTYYELMHGCTPKVSHFYVLVASALSL
jgi:hypothetical protein